MLNMPAIWKIFLEGFMQAANKVTNATMPPMVKDIVLKAFALFQFVS